jgi:opacity protein-like surface antigen
MMQFNLVRRLAVLSVLMLMAMAAMAQTARTRPKVVTNTPASFQYAHQHGYKAGYEDGHIKGRSDFNESKDREIEVSDSYKRADRGYQPSHGTRVEFQEGYRIGFEIGYNDGYFGRPFTTTQPANLRKIVVAAINADGAAAPATAVAQTPARTPVENPTTSAAGAGESTPIPRARPADETGASSSRSRTARNEIVVRDGVQMKVRLTSEINTKVNKEGDRFTAIVLDPSDYAEAEVTGHIAKLNKSGKASGKTELSLVFDSIRTRDGREGRMAAQVEKVYESETVKTVDEEGNVETSSRTKETTTRTVGGAAIGAILGGIAGGGKGAAIGAAIGAGAGVGSVLIQGGKDLILSPGTEMLIRTAAPAKTRD